MCIYRVTSFTYFSLVLDVNAYGRRNKPSGAKDE